MNIKIANFMCEMSHLPVTIRYRFHCPKPPTCPNSLG